MTDLQLTNRLIAGGSIVLAFLFFCVWMSTRETIAFVEKGYIQQVTPGGGKIWVKPPTSRPTQQAECPETQPKSEI